jgi:uncharacterized protein (TIGR00369 family)
MNIPSFTAVNPAFREMIREKLHGQHFMNHIGFDLTTIEAGRVEGMMPIIEEIKQQTGFIHGGATATFADLVMGFAAYSLVSDMQVVVTADLRISYLNPGVGEEVFAKGWVIKPGQKLIFTEGEIWVRKQGEEKLIAKASATMAVVNLSDLVR